MNKFTILRSLNQRLKYKAIKEYQGEQVLLSINKVELLSQLKTHIKEKLGFDVKVLKEDNLLRGIAKAGILDATFEIENEINYPEITGIEILKSQGWAEKGIGSNKKLGGIESLAEIDSAIVPGKNFLKLFGQVLQGGGTWIFEKTYLVKQLIRKEAIQPKPEDELIVFTIEDICITNYEGIWMWKHFYM